LTPVSTDISLRWRNATASCQVVSALRLRGEIGADRRFAAAAFLLNKRDDLHAADTPVDATTGVSTITR
jgi:hypothetical protein